MLLLTGPTGVGKTATIRSLAAELRCEVQEWTNPVLDAFNPSQTFLSDNRGQQYYYYVVPGSIIFRCTDSLALKTMFYLNPAFYFCTMRAHVDCYFVTTDFTAVGMSSFESQSTQFQEFLLRANKYPTLQIFQQHQLQQKLILVEVCLKCFNLPLIIQADN